VFPQFASVSFVGTSGLVDNYPDLAKGLAIAQVMPSPTNISLPVVREFQTAMRADGSTKMTYGAMEGYIAAEVLAAGIRKAGTSANKSQLLHALETLNLDFGGFKVAYSPGSREGSNFTEMTVVGFNGKLSR
jgi:ABC-type branched-subunit amino acid transport system substrate-binding protein